jgi:hypothetical protein
MQGGLTKGQRTLREYWLVLDGSWRHAGVEELSCELLREWCFLGSGVPVKQLRSQRKGMRVEREREREKERQRERAGWGRGSWESKVSAGSSPNEITATMLGKTATHKESPRENSRPRIGFNGR